MGDWPARLYLKERMTREEFILAAMAPGANYCYSPVQVQKLLFLLDRQIPREVNGPHFHFEPYHYGPFDSSVYSQLEQLANGVSPVCNRYLSVPVVDHEASFGETSSGRAVYRLHPRRVRCVLHYRVVIQRTARVRGVSRITVNDAVWCI